MPQVQLTAENVVRLFSALSADVQRRGSITSAGHLFRTAGFSGTGLQHWQPLIATIDQQFRQFGADDKLRTIRIIAEQLFSQSYPSDAAEQTIAMLASHGFEFVNGHFIPIGIFDQRELRFLPDAAAGQISTALDRLVAGDLDGAISAAAATVETVIASIVQVDRDNSFQDKVKGGIAAAGRVDALRDQLIGLGWEPKRAEMLVHNLRGMLNQAAFVMQTLRSDMGDVHGAKPVLEPIVYDAVKIASMLVSLMRVNSPQPVPPNAWTV